LFNNYKKKFLFSYKLPSIYYLTPADEIEFKKEISKDGKKKKMKKMKKKKKKKKRKRKKKRFK
jgi:hypothetical protein